MRATKNNAGIPGAMGLLSREIAKLFFGSEWPLRSPGENLRRRRRSLHVETLEVRHLMDAAGLASQISPEWFQTASAYDVSSHAGTAEWTAEGIVSTSNPTDPSADSSNALLYDWIVQFDTDSLAGIGTVAETVSLLVGGGIDFEVIRGLGLAGQVLVRSSGASLDAVQQWLGSVVDVAAFEQDAYRQADVTANDPQYASQWDLAKISAPSAWNLSTGSASVVVAVIDTGVDYNHVDLAANIWTNPGEIAGNGIDDDGNGFIDDIHGYDFANGDGNPLDDNGHGTHVAGTIAAVGNNGVGVSGVTWSTSIMALKFLNSDGSGYLSDAIAAVNYATMMRSRYGVNVRVENNSWGGGAFSAALQNAIRASNDAGILFVAAAGNNGTNNDASAQYPANYDSPNVISVAATNQNDQLASFSNYGATTVDIAAPGVSIYSTTPYNTYSTFSGTSMAAPHVAAVAALAWAIDPTASVADVRNAILEGADTLASLQGKVASGGRLNAYNTLQRISAQAAQGPVIGSLAVSPSAVALGSTVTVTARGLSNATGTIVGFYVSWDANNDGAYQATDPTVGITTTIVNGEASITLDTTRFGVGTQRFFAAVKDSNGKWSELSTTTLSVLPADDHGNNASTATAVGVPSSTSGTLGLAGDVDWFAFQAVAGRQYTFSVSLNTLRDSTLTLYDRNGAAQLAFNDDDGAANGSKIQWTATASGTYYLAVAAYGGNYTGTYVLNTLAANSSPVLAAVADQTMTRSQTSLNVSLAAVDADQDALTWTAEALALDPIAQQAYNLDQQLGLYQWQGSYWTNLRGAGEKYLASTTNGLAHPCFILPNGQLYRWEGSIASSTLIATLSSAYYNNPDLLCNASASFYAPLSAADVRVAVSGNTLTITRAAAYASDFYVRINVSDGIASHSQIFKVSVTNAAPVLASIADQTMARSQTTLTLALNALDADGDALTYAASPLAVDPLAQKAYDLDQQLGLYQWQGSYWTNLRGAGEKYLASTTNGLAHPCFILPNGDLYRWEGSIASSVRIASLGTAYYQNPDLLCYAQAPALAALDADQIQTSISGNVLTITRNGNQSGDFYVRVSVTDGVASDTKMFLVKATSTAAASALQIAAASASEDLRAAVSALAPRAIAASPFLASVAASGDLSPAIAEIASFSYVTSAVVRTSSEVAQSVDAVLRDLGREGPVLAGDARPDVSRQRLSRRTADILDWIHAEDRWKAQDIWQSHAFDEAAIAKCFEELASLAAEQPSTEARENSAT